MKKEINEMTKTTIFDLFSAACAELNVKVEQLRQRGDLTTSPAGSIISDLLIRIYTIRDCAAAVDLDFSYTTEDGVITSVNSRTDNTRCSRAWDPSTKCFL